MKKIILFILVLTLVILSTGQLLTPGQIDEPKPSHYVLYFVVCGSLEGAVITTTPPAWVSGTYPASDEQLVLIKQAHEEGHEQQVTLTGPECSR